MEGFIYTVNPPEPPSYGFGRNLEGNQIYRPHSRYIGAFRSYPGPSDHNAHMVWDKRGLSKKGFSSMASKVERMPTPKSNAHIFGIYNPYPTKPIKQSHVPFNVSVAAVLPIEGSTPNARRYPYHLRIGKPNINSAFGSRRKILPEVAVICSVTNEAICTYCNKTPVGDYWRDWDNKLDMCRHCRHHKIIAMKECDIDQFKRDITHRELERFKPVRHCSFYHDHCGTRAAVTTMPRKHLRIKLKTENYLKLYPENPKSCIVTIRKRRKPTIVRIANKVEILEVKEIIKYMSRIN